MRQVPMRRAGTPPDSGLEYPPRTRVSDRGEAEMKKEGVSAEKEAGKRTRASWDEYFMNLARVVASRATCDRKHVGAVIVRDRTVLSTGYNGSLRSLPHCDDEGHMMENGHCVATVHAEANAIVQAAKNGVSIDGATIYTTASPCWPCFKLIANAGCVRIVFGEFYRDERIFEYAKRLGIELTKVD